MCSNTKCTNMNFEEILSEIKLSVSRFERITLPEMDSVKLMDRMDTKYLAPFHLLPEILSEAKEFYKILEVNGERINTYDTLYYDTDSLNLYYNHHSGRRNRYKVRFRNYVSSGVSFFEIKHKTNKGRTFKTRIKQPNAFEETIAGDKADFLENTTPISAGELKGNLWVHYKRMTLVNKNTPERITIDIELNFRNNEHESQFEKLVVVEVKQPKAGGSPIKEILKKHNLRPGALSKYCLGVMTTHPEVRYNRFKRKFLHLKKIISQYDSFAAAGL